MKQRSIKFIAALLSAIALLGINVTIASANGDTIIPNASLPTAPQPTPTPTPEPYFWASLLWAEDRYSIGEQATMGFNALEASAVVTEKGISGNYRWFLSEVKRLNLDVKVNILLQYDMAMPKDVLLKQLGTLAGELESNGSVGVITLYNEPRRPLGNYYAYFTDIAAVFHAKDLQTTIKYDESLIMNIPWGNGHYLAKERISIPEMTLLTSVIGGEIFTPPVGNHMAVKPEFPNYYRDYVSASMYTNLVKSIAPDKRYHDSELHMISSVHYSHETPVGFIRNTLKYLAALGLEGGAMWGFRGHGRPYGEEHSINDREITEYLSTVAEINASPDIYRAFVNAPADFAIFYSESNLGNTQYVQNLVTLYQRLTFSNKGKVGFVTEFMVRDSESVVPSLVITPDGCRMPEDIRNALYHRDVTMRSQTDILSISPAFSANVSPEACVEVRFANLENKYVGYAFNWSNSSVGSITISDKYGSIVNIRMLNDRGTFENPIACFNISAGEIIIFELELA